MRVDRWSTWSLLSEVITKHSRSIAGMALATVVWAIDDSVVRPYLLKLLLDAMSDTAERTSSALYWYLLGIVALYAAARFVITAVVRLWDWLSVKLVPAVKAFIMERLTAYALGHAYGFAGAIGSGTVASSIHTAAEGFPQLIIPFVGRFLGSTCRVLFAVAMLWATLTPAAVIMTFWVMLFLGGGLWWAQSSRRLADAASRTYADVTGGITDILSNMLAVYLYNRQSYESSVLHRWGNEWMRAERVRDLALVKLYIIQGFSFFVLELLTVWCVVRSYLAGYSTAGDAALVVSINMVLLEALWDVPQEVTQFVRALGRVSQGLRTVTAPYTLLNKPHALPLAVERGCIVFDKVSFAYPGMVPLFTQLSFTIDPGQRVGIVGYSGSGKTTMMHLLLRLRDIQAGAIMIDNQNIAEVAQATIRDAITLIPQDPSLLHRSVLDNIRYGNLNASFDEVVEAAQHAHAHDFIVQMQGGYDAIVGEQGMYLSSGQRQRIVIARALLKNAPIIIMDEATSALDSATEEALSLAFRALTTGRTTIVIAHRISTLLEMDRILVCDAGSIVQDGTHQQLIRVPGVYRQLCELQCGRFQW